MVQRIIPDKLNLQKTQVFHFLIVGLLFTLLVWFLKYLWRKRRLYEHARKLPGPFALPLIGNALELFRNSNDVQALLTQYFNTYPRIFRVWFGTRLFYGVSDPNYIHILLNHQQALKKDELYRLAEPMLGQGLFTQKSVPKWKRYRKLIAPTFNQKILDQFVEVFTEQSEILNQVLKEYAGNGEFDLLHVVSTCTLNIICECPKRKAFLDHLLEINYREHNVFTDEDLLDETRTFMVAGTDTTATTNCFALTMLGLHPKVQDKVLQEVLEVLGPHKSVEVSDLLKLQYTERVIKETMRLFPVAAFLMRSVQENIDLGDWILPQGSSVVFGVRDVLTNEAYWPEPFKFDPDRFLPEEVAKRHPSVFLPFSFGPRNCLGMRYAYMAMKSLIATVIRKYEIHTSYKHVEDIHVKSNMVTRPVHGFKVSVELRELKHC